ncbi:pilus assembly protein [Orrella marina]|uniref:TadE-like protein n=1 Tax=Orrella marina TaxID=2163011 RepID=A0A2R4XIW7_9BURK|nr:pilus assembly protein [Orrella marina]AWB33751.1 hypothetical protein DBV39_08580 [Orrella marina]
MIWLSQRHLAFNRASGQASVEWLIAASAVVTLLWLVIEATQWFTLHHFLLLNAQRAAEHAATQGGRPLVAHQYLFRNLKPDSLRLGQVCVLDHVEDLLADFKDPNLSRQAGQDVIRHSHIAAQHQRNQAKGWQNGVGPRSDKTIAQANLLNLSVTAYQPVTLLWLRPIIGREIRLKVVVQTVMQSSREKIDWPCAGY